jgi:hypothetical protein
MPGIRVEKPDGTFLELDEETSAMAVEQAAEEGVSVEVLVKSLLHTEHLLLRHGLVKRKGTHGPEGQGGEKGEGQD